MPFPLSSAGSHPHTTTLLRWSQTYSYISSSLFSMVQIKLSIVFILVAATSISTPVLSLPVPIQRSVFLQGMIDDNSFWSYMKSTQVSIYDHLWLCFGYSPPDIALSATRGVSGMVMSAAWVYVQWSIILDFVTPLILVWVAWSQREVRLSTNASLATQPPQRQYSISPQLLVVNTLAWRNNTLACHHIMAWSSNMAWSRNMAWIRVSNIMAWTRDIMGNIMAGNIMAGNIRVMAGNIMMISMVNRDVRVGRLWHGYQVWFVESSDDVAIWMFFFSYTRSSFLVLPFYKDDGLGRLWCLWQTHNSSWFRLSYLYFYSICWSWTLNLSIFHKDWSLYIILLDSYLPGKLWIVYLGGLSRLL